MDSAEWGIKTMQRPPGNPAVSAEKRGGLGPRKGGHLIQNGVEQKAGDIEYRFVKYILQHILIPQKHDTGGEIFVAAIELQADGQISKNGERKAQITQCHGGTAQRKAGTAECVRIPVKMLGDIGMKVCTHTDGLWAAVETVYRGKMTGAGLDGAFVAQQIEEGECLLEAGLLPIGAEDPAGMAADGVDAAQKGDKKAVVITGERPISDQNILVKAEKVFYGPVPGDLIIISSFSHDGFYGRSDKGVIEPAAADGGENDGQHQKKGADNHGENIIPGETAGRIPTAAAVFAEASQFHGVGNGTDAGEAGEN